MTKPNRSAFDAAFESPKPKPIDKRESDGGYAELADFIMSSTLYNEPCPKCEKWTGTGQYTKRDGVVICRFCGIRITPSYFDNSEARAERTRKNREQMDVEDLLDIVNAQGVDWVTNQLISAGFYHP